MTSMISTIARIARPALLVAAVAVAAACGSDNNNSTGPGDVSGNYALTSVGGNSLPYAFAGSDSDIVINSAVAQLLSNGNYTVNATGSANGGGQESIIADQGTWTLSGTTISFHSSTYAHTYTAVATSTTFDATIPGAFVDSDTPSFTLNFARAM